MEIAAVASLLRNDGIGRFSFIYILRIRCGARNNNSDLITLVNGILGWTGEGVGDRIRFFQSDAGKAKIRIIGGK